MFYTHVFCFVFLKNAPTEWKNPKTLALHFSVDAGRSDTVGGCRDEVKKTTLPLTRSVSPRFKCQQSRSQTVGVGINLYF